MTDGVSVPSRSGTKPWKVTVKKRDAPKGLSTHGCWAGHEG
jgi:hypothetical protein